MVPPVGNGGGSSLNCMPKDHAFGGLYVFARDKRIAVTFAEMDGTETDDGRVGANLEVPSMWCAEEEGEDGDNEVRGHGDDGCGRKV